MKTDKEMACYGLAQPAPVAETAHSHTAHFESYTTLSSFALLPLPVIGSRCLVYTGKGLLT